MYIYILAFLVIALLIYFWKRSRITIISVKNNVLPILCFIFLLCLVIFPETSVNGAVKGINLWLNTVFPSLFPFFVASEILYGTGIIRMIGAFLEPVMRPLFNVPGSGSFALAMGITSGYPVGARITSSLRTSGLLSRHEAERLLAFTNNSGPLFIIGAVSTGMFKLPAIGVFMWACHVAACITVGIIFRFAYHKKNRSTFGPDKKKTLPFTQPKKEKPSNPGKLIGDAVGNSINLVLMIGGFIILFSVIIDILMKTGLISILSSIIAYPFEFIGVDENTIKALISGFFEITTGTNMAANGNMPLIMRLAAASAIIGWAGISVHLQVSSVIKETDISIKPYLFGKLLQGTIAAIYTVIGYQIMEGKISEYVQAFAFAKSTPAGWYVSLADSIRLLGLSFLTILILIFISSIIKAVFLFIKKLTAHV